AARGIQDSHGERIALSGARPQSSLGRAAGSFAAGVWVTCLRDDQRARTTARVVQSSGYWRGAPVLWRAIRSRYHLCTRSEVMRLWPNKALHRTAICAWGFALEFCGFIGQIVAVGE